ncbi:histone deacetylase [Desulfolithobacter dissulfuricans]|uniref:Histone deacetylase n=1 Tax=Desulfolithobacter dissulfuricans TaxID=2795293 RepID=A0A915U5K3_9BACT|nr:histone deacetylase [Desulfolithobacter dissulfuricans]BCO09187.1 histone deacetylase [Desulfolithobacter dissulfuricans]
MTTVPQIALIRDPRFLEHDTGGGDHPETPERLLAIEQQLCNGPLAPHLVFHSSRMPQREDLLSFHSEAWLFRFEEAVLAGRTYIDHPDNQVGYETYQVAQLSAGSGMVAVDLVEGGFSGPVFSCTRPPGHHAEPGMPLGFCFLNNCVLAVRYWQKEYGRRRICVLDFDAHHGNGIQTAFDKDVDTLYISIHEHPSFSYPGTGYQEEQGTGPARGTVLNIPLAPGAGDARVIEVLDGPVQDALERFQPQCLVVAAGFDAHRLDDMSGLAWSTDLYRIIGFRLGDWAARFCRGRMISILEGGYHPDSLAASVEAYLAGQLSAVTGSEGNSHPGREKSGEKQRCL